MLPAEGLLNDTSAFGLPEGSYTLTVTSTNWLNASSTATVALTLVSSCQAPVLSIIGGASQHFAIAQGIKLDSLLDATSVCAGKQVRLDSRRLQ